MELHCDERTFGILANPEELPGVTCPIAWSRKYTELPFLYWWTVTPKRLEEIKKAGKILLGQKDTGNYTFVSANDIELLLIPERQVIAEGKTPAWHLRSYHYV